MLLPRGPATNLSVSPSMSRRGEDSTCTECEGTIPAQVFVLTKKSVSTATIMGMAKA